jgi:hypothetical protein
MLAANLKITNSEGETKKVAALVRHEELPCVDVATFSKSNHKIREPIASTDKIYNFYFLGGTLSATIDQLVLCQGRKILTMGEALITKTRVHTGSGLCLPHQIENSSPKSIVFNITPCGHMNRAAIIQSVFVF